MKRRRQTLQGVDKRKRYEPEDEVVVILDDDFDVDPVCTFAPSEPHRAAATASSPICIEDEDCVIYLDSEDEHSDAPEPRADSSAYVNLSQDMSRDLQLELSQIQPNVSESQPEERSSTGDQLPSLLQGPAQAHLEGRLDGHSGPRSEEQSQKIELFQAERFALVVPAHFAESPAKATTDQLERAPPGRALFTSESDVESDATSAMRSSCTRECSIELNEPSSFADDMAQFIVLRPEEVFAKIIKNPQSSESCLIGSNHPSEAVPSDSDTTTAGRKVDLPPKTDPSTNVQNNSIRRRRRRSAVLTGFLAHHKENERASPISSEDKLSSDTSVDPNSDARSFLSESQSSTADIMESKRSDLSKHSRMQALIAARRKRRSERIWTFSDVPVRESPRFRNCGVVGNGILVKESTIVNGGRGVFADRHYKKNDLVTEYHGEIITKKEAQKRRKRGCFQYLATLSIGNTNIDGLQEPVAGLGCASLINHCRPPNCRWKTVDDRWSGRSRLFAQAARDICPGEELFLDYGPTYWRLHKIWGTHLSQGLLDQLDNEPLTDSEESESDQQGIVVEAATGRVLQANIPHFVINPSQPSRQNETEGLGRETLWAPTALCS